MNRWYPINIKIKYGPAVVKLPTHRDRVETHEGVILYVVQKPDGSWRAMAQIPDGTLNKYKRFIPEILKCDWAVRNGLYL